MIESDCYLLVTHKDDGNIGAEVFDLRSPLLWDILQTVGRIYTKAHEDYIGVGVGERPQSIIVLLSSCIP